MYCAATGTFLQRDPLGQPGSAELLYSDEYVTNRMRSRKRTSTSHFGDNNLYEYARSNPVVFVDPTGLDVELNQGAWTAFWSSLGSSFGSMPTGLAGGIAQLSYSDPTIAQGLYEQAYRAGPLGQSSGPRVDAGDFATYFGTRVMLGVATICAAAAGSLLVYEITLANGAGTLRLDTQMFGSNHVLVEVEGQTYHAVGRSVIQLHPAGAGDLAMASEAGYFNTLTIPLRNPGAATQFANNAINSGCQFANCFTAAVRVIISGI